MSNVGVNAVGHTFGKRPYENSGTNVRWLALITGGEGWYNHPRCPDLGLVIGFDSAPGHGLVVHPWPRSLGLAQVRHDRPVLVATGARIRPPRSPASAPGRAARVARHVGGCPAEGDRPGHRGTVGPMDIVSALFVENFDLRQAPGPSTRIDLTGVFFSLAAPQPARVTITLTLVVLIRGRPRGASAMHPR